MNISPVQTVSATGVAPMHTPNGFENVLRRFLSPGRETDSPELAQELERASVPQAWNIVALVSGGKIAYAAQDERGFRPMKAKPLDVPIPPAHELKELVMVLDRQGEDLLAVMRDSERTAPVDFEVVHWVMEGLDPVSQTVAFATDPFYPDGEIFSAQVPQGTVRPTLIIVSSRT